ncbi:MAG: 8-oxo-dGTP diphosphatase MutT [Verrucomicrobia bacterium]|nr:MAG: 8-oxo-dGTP diphosphatase MutT [Verrucomicrobiota bacterium]
MSTPIIDVAAGLVFRDGRLLVAQRLPGSHLAGLWEFPGGKLDPGEDWIAALRRELSEEIGIVVSPGSLFEEVVHAYPEKTVRLRFYACRWESGEPRALGCAAIDWITRDELGKHRFPEADRRLLERLSTESALWSA